ncbi:transport protein particle component [Xylariomycetidae sp. FL0641]|nr:transport protein particle component [Xylariomycetidae sp. FL0641]
MSFDAPLPPFNASDPNATFVGTSCLDLLLIEIVPMAYRLAHELDGTAAAAADEQSAKSENRKSTTTTVTSPPPASARTATKMDDDEEREAVFFRLEALGYRVGLGLVERFSRDRPRFNDTLDAIKFVCKDLWMLVFKKQVDNLKTNHRGVYVLSDHAFRPLARMSTDAGGRAVARAQPFLWFPCGILRGALAAMGISATVQAETSELPGAVFQIKTVTAKH